MVYVFQQQLDYFCWAYEDILRITMHENINLTHCTHSAITKNYFLYGYYVMAGLALRITDS